MDDYRWVALDRSDAPVADVATASFPTQVDVEAWLAESWADLADVGVAAVTLMCFDDVVYGPMSLDPPS